MSGTLNRRKFLPAATSSVPAILRGAEPKPKEETVAFFLVCTFRIKFSRHIRTEQMLDDSA